MVIDLELFRQKAVYLAQFKQENANNTASHLSQLAGRQVSRQKKCRIEHMII